MERCFIRIALLKPPSLLQEGRGLGEGFVLSTNYLV